MLRSLHFLIIGGGWVGLSHLMDSGVAGALCDGARVDGRAALERAFRI